MVLPKVSIIIASYNHGNFLSDSINSVLRQAYPDLELIVIDDGSTDNTREILKGFKGQFYWESQTNIGQSQTLNRGWAMASGNILGYLSADDFLLPGAIEKLVKCLMSNKSSSLCYPDFRLVDTKSRVVRDVKAPDFDCLRMISEIECAPGPGALFRREAYDKVGGWEPKLTRFPDYEFFLRLSQCGEFVHLSETLAAFRVHDNSISFSEISEVASDEISSIIRDFFTRSDLAENVLKLKKIAESNALLVSSQMHFRSGRYICGLVKIVKAINCRPLAFLSIRTYRIIANGLVNRFCHKILFAIRNFLGHHAKT